MPFVFSTKIVNNFWDTTLDSKSLALKIFEAKTFEDEISDANLAHAYLYKMSIVTASSSCGFKPLTPKKFEAKTSEAGSLMQIY